MIVSVPTGPADTSDLVATTHEGDYANSVSASGGFVMSMRPLNYVGPETYCDATGHCFTGKVILNTKPGFDSMTGLGSVGAKFISTLSKF